MKIVVEISPIRAIRILVLSVLIFIMGCQSTKPNPSTTTETMKGKDVKTKESETIEPKFIEIDSRVKDEKSFNWTFLKDGDEKPDKREK